MEKNRIDDYQEQVRINIKTNITELRKANGLSKRDVAEALGINENTYRIWEDPRRSSPKMHNLVKIAQIYRVSCDFLLTDNTRHSQKKIPTSVSCETEEDKKQKYLSTLDRYERLMVLKIRQLDPEEKEKLNEMVEALLEEQI